MIAVVGKPNVTLKRLMVEDGFPHLSNYTSRGRSVTQELDGVFNCSYTLTQLRDYVLRRWSWVQDDLPIINKVLVPNKLKAQQKMYDKGLHDHILVHNETGISEYDLSRDPNGWLLKPYNSQGGRGIKIYEGERVRSGFYLQKNAKKFREFRAHVGLWLENPVFTIQEKKPKPELFDDLIGDPDYYFWPIEEAEVREALPVTWNIESGFYFRRSTTPENREEKANRYPLFARIEELAIKAVAAIGYQFGAVDILMDEDRQLWVIEVNSHPAIKNEESKRIYKIALEPLKEINKMDLFNLTQQTSRRLTSRTFVRGEGFVE